MEDSRDDRTQFPDKPQLARAAPLLRQAIQLELYALIPTFYNAKMKEIRCTYEYNRKKRKNKRQKGSKQKKDEKGRQRGQKVKHKAKQIPSMPQRLR